MFKCTRGPGFESCNLGTLHTTDKLLHYKTVISDLVKHFNAKSLSKSQRPKTIDATWINNLCCMLLNL